MDKRRVLYVDRRYPEFSRGNIARQKSVLDFLMKNFEVDMRFDLDLSIIDLIEKRVRAGEGYDVLITHVPYVRNNDPVRLLAFRTDKALYYEMTYEVSLDIIRKIKEKYSQLYILAYTGVDRTPEVENLFKENGIDNIVFKGWHNDLDWIDIEIKLKQD